MAKAISRLAIIVSADVGKVFQGFNDVETRLKDFAREVENSDRATRGRARAMSDEMSRAAQRVASDWEVAAMRQGWAAEKMARSMQQLGRVAALSSGGPFPTLADAWRQAGVPVSTVVTRERLGELEARRKEAFDRRAREIATPHLRAAEKFNDVAERELGKRLERQIEARDRAFDRAGMLKPVVGREDREQGPRRAAAWANLFADSLEFGLKRALAGAAATIKSAFAAGIGFALHEAFDTFAPSRVAQRILEVADLGTKASAIGMTARELSAMRYAAKQAGLEVGVVDHALVQMQQNIGRFALRVKTGSGIDLRAFGLDVDKFASADVVTRTQQLSDVFQRMGGGVERATLARAVFGRTARQMSQLLERGGIAEAAKRGEQLGVVFDERDVEGARNAAVAIREAEAAVEGLKTQIALALAPMIREGVQGFLAWADSMGGIRVIAQDMARFVVGAVANILEVVERLVNALIRLRNIGSDISDIPAKSVEGLKFAFTLGRYEMQEVGGDLEEVDFSDTISRLRELQDEIGEAKSGGGGSFDTRDSAARLMDTEAAALNARLQDQLHAVGLAGPALEIYKMELRGATDAQLELARATERQIEAQKDLISAQAEGERMRLAARGKARIAFDEIGDATRLLDRGVIDKYTWAGVAQRALTRLDNGKASLPEAAIAGSTQAASAVARARTRDQGASLKDAIDVLKNMEELERSMRDSLLEMAVQNGILTGDQL